MWLWQPMLIKHHCICAMLPTCTSLYGWKANEAIDEVVWCCCTVTLAGNSGQIALGLLQLIKSCCQCAMHEGITVVELGNNNAARDCESNVVGQRDVGQEYRSCRLSWLLHLAVILHLGVDGHAERHELQHDWLSDSSNVDSGDVGSWQELNSGTEKDDFWLVSIKLHTIL